MSDNLDQPPPGGWWPETLSFAESPETGLPTTEPIEAVKTRMWLRAMLDQGEDRIWRGAEIAMRYLTQTEIERDRLKGALQAVQEICEAEQGDGEKGRRIYRCVSQAIANAVA